jgi:uncharacterized protein involved in exopolysaccharide biosynthesis
MKQPSDRAETVGRFVAGLDPRRAEAAPRTVLNLTVAILIACVVAAGGALVVRHRSTPTYQSAASLLIDQPQAIAASLDAGIILKLGAVRIKYSELLATEVIAGPTASRLGLPEGYVAASLFSVVNPGSLLLVIGARGRDPLVTQREAEAAAEQVALTASAEQSANQIPVLQRYVFRLVIPASRGGKLPQSKKRMAAVGGGLGVVAGAAAYLLLQLLSFRREPR